MPVVISYEDVAKLGELAKEGGYAFGRREAEDRNERMLARMDETDIARQQLRAQQEQASWQRSMQAAEFALQRDVAAANIGMRQADIQADLARAGLQSDTTLAREQLRQGFTMDRDQQLHRQTLERIEAERRAGKFTNADNAPGNKQPALSATGLPNAAWAQQEVNQFADLIPQGSAGGILDDPIKAAKGNMQLAAALAALPTSQLRGRLAANPNDEWSGFLRGILQARDKSAPGSPGSPFRGAQAGQVGGLQALFPGVNRGQVRSEIPNQSGAYGEASGGDPVLGQLSDEELMELLNDPARAEQLLGGGY